MKRKQEMDGYVISRRGMDSIAVALVGGALFARHVELVADTIAEKAPGTSEEAADLAQKAKDTSAILQEALDVLNVIKATGRV